MPETRSCDHCCQPIAKPVRGHNRLRRGGPSWVYCSTLCRVLSQVDIPADRSQCWVWTGATNPGGYGQTMGPDTPIRVHRLVYEKANGPIPEGRVLDHLCRNRACCNPQHLEAVTQRTNVHRGEGRAGVNSRKTHCDHGHPLSGDNLYLHPRGERQCRACARNAARAYRERRRRREEAADAERRSKS